jgi:hypothetical protein
MRELAIENGYNKIYKPERPGGYANAEFGLGEDLGRSSIEEVGQLIDKIKQACECD